MKGISYRNRRYLLIVAVASLNLFLFQNCSNYAVSLSDTEKIARANKELQEIADNSPALNDNVPIQIEHVNPHPDDLMPEELGLNSNSNSNSMVNLDDMKEEDDDMSVDDNDHQNEMVSNDDDDDDDGCNNRHHGKDPKCDNSHEDREHQSLCGKLAEAGDRFRGFRVINLTSADSDKSFNSHGKTIYVYSGAAPLILQSVSSSGKTVICGNISISNLSANGNCHLIHAQAENAEINGNLTTSVLGEDGIDKVMDVKQGRDVKSCRVGADSLIKSND